MAQLAEKGVALTTAAPGSCPVCNDPATVIDWRPGLDWVAIEGCGCGGFFVWTPVLQGRLASLTAADHEELAGRIRWHRARGCEAWLATIDGTVHGTLVIGDARPDRPR